MRNIFDQYSHVENRVTHAFASALNEDRQLLSYFLKSAGVSPPCKAAELEILVQQIPGENEPTEEEAERRGIPDIWIFSIQQSWCLVVEAKVQAGLLSDQITRHRRMALRRGFRNVSVAAITVRLPRYPITGCTILQWREIYVWLGLFGRTHEWAMRLRRYLEIVEAGMVDKQQSLPGTLTTFAGIPFGSNSEYTYLEAKRILGLATEQLRKNAELKLLGMDPGAPGRPAITGRDSDRVWDFLPIVASRNAKNFTDYPHLTIGISKDVVEAMITVPNSVNSVMKTRIKELGLAGFTRNLEKILRNMRPLIKHGAQPWFRGVQRRYPSQKATPFIDARIDFDLRTAFDSGPPKSQPVWLAAGFEAFQRKHKTNYQFQVGALIPLEDSPKMRTPQGLSIVSAAWVACKPLIDLAAE